ncbi:MAG: transcriptional activator NhaR [Myxococcota bacterium]
MEWLNYHHLLYFWTVGRRGSIAKASEELGLAQPTISGQIRALEETLGEKLFRRDGRSLVMTETGEVVFRYASDIFTTGQELMDMLRGRPSGRPTRLHVGVADGLPKTLVHHILEPVLHIEPETQLICRGDKTERLLAELSLRGFDMVLSDEPISGRTRIRAFNHVLGETTMTVFGTPALVERYRPHWPRSLDGAPFLLPGENVPVRRSLEQWLDSLGTKVHVVAEFEDSALLKQFGMKGEGLFIAPTSLEEDIRRVYGCHALGEATEVVERVYAITVERRIKHPAVQAIVDRARGSVFGTPHVAAS